MTLAIDSGFLTPDIIFCVAQYLEGWDTLYQFALTSKSMYSLLTARPSHLPWVHNSGKDQKACVFPSMTAKTLVVVSECQPQDYINLLNQFSRVYWVDITAQQPQSKRYYKALIKAMILLSRRLCLCITNEQHNVLTPIAKHGQSLLEHPLITTEPTYLAEAKSPTISSQTASDHQVQAQPSPSAPLPSSIELTKQHSCRSQSVSQSNTPCTTTSQQFSAMLDPDFLDKIETPEDVRRTKALAKAAAFITKKAHFRPIQTEASQSITIPWACLRLVNRSAKYIRCNMNTENDTRLSPTSIVNRSTASDVATKYAPQLIESIIQFDGLFFFVTSLDLFWHNRPNVDDCANNESIAFSVTPNAAIKTKTMFKKTFYELSIFFGHLEFLCTGGFWGGWTSSELKPFLGSSIRGLPQSMKGSNTTTNIFVTATAQRSTFSTRLLREYGNMASNSALGCHSSHFANSGFYPVNPLQYDDHPAISSTNGRSINSIFSFILRCIAAGTVKKEDIVDLLRRAALIKESATYFKSNTTTFKLLAAEMDSSTRCTAFQQITIGLIAELESIAENNGSDNNIIPHLPSIKKKVLSAVNAHYSKTIKNANDKVIKLYRSSHPHIFNIPSIDL